MPLEVSFTLQKADLLLGEDTEARLRLANPGPAALIVPDPRAGTMPVFRVVQLATGAEMLMRPESYEEERQDTVPVPPGGTLEASVPLLRAVKWPLPGEYALSALYSYNQGKDMAESGPVRVKVRPLAARSLFLDYAHADYVTGTFINPAADPPDVVLMRFAIEEGGGARAVQAVGKGTILARPCKSLPPNTQADSGEWVAWLDGSVMRFLHWSSDEQAAVEGDLRIPGGEPEIVASLYVQPSAPGVQRGDGGALLWASDPARGGTILHAVQLQVAGNTAKARIEASLALPGPRPKWSMSYAHSDGSRRLVYLGGADNRLELFAIPWPAAQAAIQPRPVQVWEGEFVGAGATLAADDSLRGAVLMWTGEQEARRLELVGWMLDSAGSVRQHFRDTVPWASSVPISPAIVKARITGMPAALLRKYGAEWVVYDAFEKLMPVPSPYADTKLPLDFLFFGLREVVLVCGEPLGGLSVKRMDGSDLPPRIK